MSQDFRLKFDQMKQGNPVTPNGELVKNENKSFDSAGYVRNLCLVWPDNRMKLFNYAYLVSGEYLPEDGSITLAFTTHTVIIKGSMLRGLFEDLLSHLPRKIICIEDRYRSSIDNNKPVIDNIQVMIN